MRLQQEPLSASGMDATEISRNTFDIVDSEGNRVQGAKEILEAICSNIGNFAREPQFSIVVPIPASINVPVIICPPDKRIVLYETHEFHAPPVPAILWYYVLYDGLAEFALSVTRWHMQKASFSRVSFKGIHFKKGRSLYCSSSTITSCFIRYSLLP